MTDEKQPTISDLFHQSWKHPEEFYFSAPERWDLHRMPKILAQLQDLRYRSTFRAGLSLGTFILSRSREHSLRADQPYIAIAPNLKGGLVVRYLSGGYPFSEDNLIEAINTDTMEITLQVEALLKCLAEHPID